MYDDMWQSTVIALLHIERTILVFQRSTLLHPFPHINLSRVLSLPLCSCVPRLWLICLCSYVIKSCQSPSLHTYNSSHLIIFERLYGHWAYRLFHSLLYILCTTCPFLIQMCFVSRNGIWKCVLAYVWMMFHYIVLSFHQLPTRAACDNVLGGAVFFF